MYLWQSVSEQFYRSKGSKDNLQKGPFQDQRLVLISSLEAAYNVNPVLQFYL